jgi:hypothetical protein
MTDVPKSFGGLVMTREEDAFTHIVTLTLTCATHYRDWRLQGTIRVEALRIAERQVLHLGVMRSDRGATVLDLVSQGLMREARHSLRTCRCASPLFDDDGAK